MVATVAQAAWHSMYQIGNACYTAGMGIVNKFTTIGSLIFVGVVTGLILFGLFPILAPQTAMLCVDATYGIVVFPVADFTTQYLLHVPRDFVVLPLARWWNEIWQHRVDETFQARINQSDDIVHAGHFTVDSFSAIVDAWTDYVAMDLMFAFSNGTDIRWGPARVRVPFVKWIIDSTNLFYSDGLSIPPPAFMIGSSLIRAVKNITMTWIRLDYFSKSCYFQHLRTCDQGGWALEGCYMFDTSFCPLLADHVAGTCTGCHNTSKDLINVYVTNFFVGWERILTDMTKEIMYVTRSFDVDPCAAVAGATCDAAAAAERNSTTCSCSGFNCSNMDWWLQPSTMIGSHCWEGETRTIGMPLFGDADCAALNALCHAPPPTVPTAGCALVDESPRYSYLLRNRTCLDVGALAPAGIATRPCHDIFADDCELRDWSWWVHRVMTKTTGVFTGFFGSVADATLCEWDWFRSVIAGLYLTVDPTCVHGMVSNWVHWLQFLFYYPISLDPFSCLTYVTDYLLQFKIKALSTGTRDMFVLSKDVVASIWDGSVLTRSCFYCNAVRQPDRQCGGLARTEGTSCTQIPTGIRILGARCSSVGFFDPGTSLTECYPNPCISNVADEDMCAFFAGTSCLDTQVSVGGSTTVDAMDVAWLTYPNAPQPNCSMYNSGCWAVSTGDCRMFAGCHAFEGCTSGNCHAYTRRFWQIMNSSFYEPGYNLLTWFGASEDASRKTMAMWGYTCDAMACVFDNLKAIVGLTILSADGGCQSTATAKLDYFVNDVVGKVIGCWSVLADYFETVGSAWLHARTSEYVTVLKTLLPHTWNGDIMHSNSYYCNMWSELVVVEKLDEPAPPRHWIFEGCHGFRDGLCDIAWKTDPGFHGTVLNMTFGDPYGDVIMDISNDTCELIRMALVAIRVPEEIVTPLVGIVDGTFQMVTDLTLNWFRNTIAFFVLAFDGPCTQKSQTGYYLLTDVVIWPINVILNYIIDVTEHLWQILEEAFIAIVKKFDLLKFIFDASDDIATIAYCFTTGIVNSTRYEFPEMSNRAPDFPACVKAWPKPYGMSLGCSMHSCWDNAWLCVVYNDTTAVSSDDYVPREYNWFGKAFAKAWVGDAVSAAISILDGIVCPFNCIIDNCPHCSVFRAIACFFRCLAPPWTYTCEDGDETTDADADLQEFLKLAYKYDCGTRCGACGTTDSYWECLAECTLSNGEVDVTHYPLDLTATPGTTLSTVTCPNNFSREGVNFARWTHTLPEGGHSLNEWYSWRKHPAPFDKQNPADVWGRLKTKMASGWIAPTADAPAAVRRPAWYPWDYGSSTDPELPYIGQDAPHAWWTYKALRADEFCTSACAASGVYQSASTTQRAGYAAACRAFRSALRFNDPATDTDPPLYGLPSNDRMFWTVGRQYAEWALTGVDDASYTDSLWCGNFTLYDEFGGVQLSARSFQGFLCNLQKYSDMGSPLTLIASRYQFGEPEQAPELERLLWGTYLSPMHRRYRDSFVPLDCSVWCLGLDWGRQFAVCLNNGGPDYSYSGADPVWTPLYQWDTTYNAETLQQILYAPPSVTALGDPAWAYFTHYAADGGAPNNTVGFIAKYVAAAMYGPGSSAKHGLRAQEAKAREPSFRLPTPEELRRKSGRNDAAGTAPSARYDPAFFETARAAYEAVAETGTRARPYRNAAEFASAVAAGPCPSAVERPELAGCFCEAYLADCGSAETKYGLQGNGTIFERLAFRTCAGAWDALTHAESDSARQTATKVLCMDEDTVPMTERLSALTSAFMDPLSGSKRTSRLLSAEAVFGPERATAAQMLGSVVALKGNVAAALSKVGEVYAGSWLDVSIAEGRKLGLARSSASRGAADDEAKLAWTASALRRLTGVLAPRDGELLSAAISGQGDRRISVHGRRIDSQGRTPLQRLATRALRTVERELSRTRGETAVVAEARKPVRTSATDGGDPTRELLITGLQSLQTAALRYFGGPQTRAEASTTPGMGRMTAGAAEAIGEQKRHGWFSFDFEPPPDRPRHKSLPFYLRSTYAADAVKGLKAVGGEIVDSLRRETGLIDPDAPLVRMRVGTAPNSSDLSDADVFFDLFGTWVKDQCRKIVDSIDTEGIEHTFIKLGDWIVDVVSCDYPVQVNSTKPYNVFCLLRLPEGWYSWAPLGPFTPAQVQWDPRLIATDCVNDDYPDRVNYTRYWQMHKNNCRNNDSYSRPGCPGVSWCKREFSPEVIHMDIVDSAIMLVDRLADLAHDALHPDMGEDISTADRLHWIVNFWMLVLLPRLLTFVPFVGTALVPLWAGLGWTFAIMYAWNGGLLLHGVLVIFMWYTVPMLYNVIFLCALGPLVLYGGFSWARPDVVSWAATGLCTVTDPGVLWFVGMFPELCDRLRIVAVHGAESGYLQLWGLYFGKWLTATLLAYVLFVGLAWIVVALVVYTFQFAVAVYVVIRDEVRGAKIRKNSEEIQQVRAAKPRNAKLGKAYSALAEGRRPAAPT